MVVIGVVMQLSFLHKKASDNTNTSRSNTNKLEIRNKGVWCYPRKNTRFFVETPFWRVLHRNFFLMFICLLWYYINSSIKEMKGTLLQTLCESNEGSRHMQYELDVSINYSKTYVISQEKILCEFYNHSIRFLQDIIHKYLEVLLSDQYSCRIIQNILNTDNDELRRLALQVLICKLQEHSQNNLIHLISTNQNGNHIIQAIVEKSCQIGNEKSISFIEEYILSNLHSLAVHQYAFDLSFNNGNNNKNHNNGGNDPEFDPNLFYPKQPPRLGYELTKEKKAVCKQLFLNRGDHINNQYIDTIENILELKPQCPQMSSLQHLSIVIYELRSQYPMAKYRYHLLSVKQRCEHGETDIFKLIPFLGNYLNTFQSHTAHIKCLENYSIALDLQTRQGGNAYYSSQRAFAVSKILLNASKSALKDIKHSGIQDRSFIEKADEISKCEKKEKCII